VDITATKSILLNTIGLIHLLYIFSSYLIYPSNEIAENLDEIKELLETGFVRLPKGQVNFPKKTQMNKNYSAKSISNYPKVADVR
jgi:hypothetical protein